MADLSPVAAIKLRIAQLILRARAHADEDTERASREMFAHASEAHEAMRQRADDIEYRLRQIRIVRERDGR